MSFTDRLKTKLSLPSRNRSRSSSRIAAEHHLSRSSTLVPPEVLPAKQQQCLPNTAATLEDSTLPTSAPPSADDALPAPAALSKTPIWEKAVLSLKAQSIEAYSKLELDGQQLNESEPDIVAASDISLDVRTTKARRWLPHIAALKPIATSLAGIDPYQIAPLVVAGAFFAIEIVLHEVPDDVKETVREILCDTAVVVGKWVSCEASLVQRVKTSEDPEIQSTLRKLQGDLFPLYENVLKLQVEIRNACRSERKLAMTAAFSGAVDDWKLKIAEIKRLERKCVVHKDDLETCLKEKEHVAKVLKWIRAPDDPEPGHRQILSRTRLDLPEYYNAGRWFVESPEFQGWMDQIENPAGDLKRLLWLRGTMGTGKTTLMCRVITTLTEEYPHDKWETSYYYCTTTATTQAAPETVLRGICQRLAWAPDTSIAPHAQAFYDKHADNVGSAPVSDDWLTLSCNVINNQAVPVVVIIDALDECSRPEELLKVLVSLLTECPRLFILCSSRHQVPVRGWLDGHTEELDATSIKAATDMQSFIRKELSRRRASPETRHSIFFKPGNELLVHDLEKSLRERASGMYRWVDVWLSVIFPEYESRKQVRSQRRAKEYLKNIEGGAGEEQLTRAYEALWEENDSGDFKHLLPRLFHLMLSDVIGFTLRQLTEALRIDLEDPSAYHKELEEQDVESLFYNLLVVSPNTNWLTWAHESAKAYVQNRKRADGTTLEFMKLQNTLTVLQIFGQLLANRDHPAWADAGFDLPSLQQICELDSCESLVSQTFEFIESRPNGRDKRRSSSMTTDLLEALSGEASDDNIARLIRLVIPLTRNETFMGLVMWSFLRVFRRLLSRDTDDYVDEGRTILCHALSTCNSALRCVMFGMSAVREWGYRMIRVFVNSVFESVWHRDSWPLRDLGSYRNGVFVLHPLHVLAFFDISPLEVSENRSFKLLVDRADPFGFSGMNETALQMSCRVGSKPMAGWLLDLDLEACRGGPQRLIWQASGTQRLIEEGRKDGLDIRGVSAILMAERLNLAPKGTIQGKLGTTDHQFPYDSDYTKILTAEDICMAPGQNREVHALLPMATSASATEGDMLGFVSMIYIHNACGMPLQVAAFHGHTDLVGMLLAHESKLLATFAESARDTTIMNSGLQAPAYRLSAYYPALARHIGDHAKYNLTHVSLGEDGHYFVRDESGIAWWNLPDSISKHVPRLTDTDDENPVQRLSLGTDNAWFAHYRDGSYNRDFRDKYDDLEERLHQNPEGVGFLALTPATNVVYAAGFTNGSMVVAYPHIESYDNYSYRGRQPVPGYT